MKTSAHTLKWAYGVTTVKDRAADLLPRTLLSLQKAGFDQPHLFVDGQHSGEWWLQLCKSLHVHCVGLTMRNPNVYTAGNWVLSLYELYYRKPEAHRYVLFQDDLLAGLNLKSYLERCKLPEKAYFNLYTFPSNQSLADQIGTRGWFRARNLNSGPEDYQTGRGAVGLMFTREGVLTLLSARSLVERPLDATIRHRKIDGGVVEAMNRAGWSEYCHNPSLLQHTGHPNYVTHGRHSTMNNLPHLQATSFLGEEYDYLKLLEV